MVVVFVSFVVVSVTVLPSLLCVVVVTVLFSVVPFWLSQPMVNTPSAEIRTNARKRFISIPFQNKLVSSFRRQEPFLSGRQEHNQSTLYSWAASALFMPRQSLVIACLGDLPCLPVFRILLLTAELRQKRKGM